MKVKFINWCNSNQGFLSFLLSALTLLVSIIAIVISIISMRTQYKKKINVEGSCMVVNNDNKVHIYISNIGNKVVSIKQINVIYENVSIGGTGRFKDNERILKPSEIREFVVDAYLEDIDGFIKKGHILIEDTEDDTFKSSRILPMI